MKQTCLFMKYQVLYLWTVFFMFSTGVWATDYGRRSRENARPEVDTRKQQMEQEAQAMTSIVQKALTDLLEPVQKNQHPSEDLIQKSQLVIDNTKRYFNGFDDKSKARFMLLQAWTAFYQGDSDLALNWAMRACKTDEASQDAWISQAVFVLLSGRPPALPRIEEPQSQSESQRTMNRRPRRVDTAVETKPQPYSEKGILEFDLLGLNIKMFREQFNNTEFQTTSGEKIDYKPGADMLCILFWEDIPDLSADVSDSQQPATNGVEDEVQKAIQQALQQAVPGMAESMNSAYYGGSYDSQKNDIESQRSYFEELMDACKDKPEIKFFQIDTFKPSQPDSLNALPDDSQGLIPTVIAASPQSNARQFAGLPAEKPFMVFVDKDGRVRYAGTAADFVPAFILTELTGVPIDLDKNNEATTSNRMDSPMMIDIYMPEMTAGRTNSVADPNSPRTDPNIPAQSGRFIPRPTQKQSDFPTQSLEDQIRAEKLLQSAQMHIEESRKLSMKNPSQGIEDARKVLAELPNTEYAEKARELLRRVPERWKEQHNITDEELGY